MSSGVVVDARLKGRSVVTLRYWRSLGLAKAVIEGGVKDSVVGSGYGCQQWRIHRCAMHCERTEEKWGRSRE